MRINYKTAIALLMTTYLSGCAPMISGSMNAMLSEEDIKLKTAEYFGVEPSEFTITNIKKNALATNYRLSLNGKKYNCNVYYGAVSCKEPGTY